MNQNVKNLIQKLGEAIHESVSESENIAGVVKNIREEGFDVLLMLEATIGLNQVDGGAATGDEAADADSQAEHGPFTSHDLNFLKSLRITLPDYDAGKLSNSDAKLIDLTVDLDGEQSNELPSDPSAES
jgi:hypothetical protein